MKYRLIKRYPNCGIYLGNTVALFGNDYRALISNGQRIYIDLLKKLVESKPNG